MLSLVGTCSRNENFRRKYNRRNNFPANFSHRQRLLLLPGGLSNWIIAWAESERAGEGRGSVFPREAAEESRVSQECVTRRNIWSESSRTRSRVRERGTSSTKCKGWLRTDGRKERMSYLDGCFQAAPFRRCRRAIFVPRCKSFYEVCVLSLFSKLDTKWIFLFLPSAVRRAYTVYRLSHRYRISFSSIDIVKEITINYIYFYIHLLLFLNWLVLS